MILYNFHSLYWQIIGKLLATELEIIGNYWQIIGNCIGNYWQIIGK
jgi:hypothetical protein